MDTRVLRVPMMAFVGITLASCNFGSSRPPTPSGPVETAVEGTSNGNGSPPASPPETMVRSQPPLSPVFEDVPATHWAFESIQKLYANGFINGCSADPLRFCPEALMSRAEAAVIIVRGVHGATFAPPAPRGVFADVPREAWHGKWVETLWSDGFTAGCGKDKSGLALFCPLAEHTRAEAVVFFLRMMRGVSYIPSTTGEAPSFVYADVPPGDGGAWYGKWVYAAYDAGLIAECEDGLNRGDQRFRPMDKLTRAEAACMMSRALGLLP